MSWSGDEVLCGLIGEMMRKRKHMKKMLVVFDSQKRIKEIKTKWFSSHRDRSGSCDGPFPWVVLLDDEALDYAPTEVVRQEIIDAIANHQKWARRTRISRPLNHFNRRLIALAKRLGFLKDRWYWRKNWMQKSIGNTPWRRLRDRLDAAFCGKEIEDAGAEAPKE